MLRQFSVPGPFFLASQLREGDCYELENGHPIECLPGGARHAKLEFEWWARPGDRPGSGISGRRCRIHAGRTYPARAGYHRGECPGSSGLGALGAPPPLAVEYADVGQNERDLQAKIRTLLGAGTRVVLRQLQRVTGQLPEASRQQIGQTQPGWLSGTVQGAAGFRPAWRSGGLVGTQPMMPSAKRREAKDKGGQVRCRKDQRVGGPHPARSTHPPRCPFLSGRISRKPSVSCLLKTSVNCSWASIFLDAECGFLESTCHALEARLCAAVVKAPILKNRIVDLGGI